MYANDVLIFTKANKKSLQFFKSILTEISQFSGLDIKSDKSSSTISKICKSNPELKDILGFPNKDLPITYLGLLITGKKKAHNQC